MKNKLDKIELPRQLSEILKNPHLPTEIHNAILRGIDDVSNNADSGALEQFETSPEYLEAIFSAYEAKNPIEKLDYKDFFAACHRQTAERLDKVFSSEKVSNEVKNILEAV